MAITGDKLSSTRNVKKIPFLLILFLPGISFAGTITTYGSNMSFAYVSSTGGSSLNFVQAVSTATNDGGCGSTLGPVTVAAGDLLVLGCATTSNASGITPSDVSDTWLNAGTSTNGGTNLVGIWYVKSAVGGATTVTAATNGCNGVNYCILAEYRGQNTSSTFDVYSGSAPVATGLSSITTTAATTTGTNELMFGFVMESSGGAFTAQSGTSRLISGINPQWAAQDVNVPTAGSYTSTWTETAPYVWAAAQAAFNHK